MTDHTPKLSVLPFEVALLLVADITDLGRA